jgi:hypothetical protein
MRGLKQHRVHLEITSRRTWSGRSTNLGSIADTGKPFFFFSNIFLCNRYWRVLSVGVMKLALRVRGNTSPLLHTSSIHDAWLSMGTTLHSYQ